MDTILILSTDHLIIIFVESLLKKIRKNYGLRLIKGLHGTRVHQSTKVEI